MDSTSRVTLSSRFLGLLEGVPTLHFTGVQHLEKTLRDLRGALFTDRKPPQYFVFTDVPYDIFHRLKDTKSSALFHPQCLYFHHEQLLRVKMPTTMHGEAGGGFSQTLITKLVGMNVIQEMRCHLNSTQNLGTVHKEPDASWGPAAPKPPQPTCVLEVDYSENAAHLALDAAIWLESPKTHCRQAITVNIITVEAKIIFKKWELSRPPVHNTRSGGRRAKVVEEAEVTLVGNAPTVKNNRSLHLSFSNLIGRDPTPGTSEADIEFTPEDLGNIARLVWVVQRIPGSQETILTS